jgi:hypothetical protein
VLANGFARPGAGGTIFKLNRADGSVVARSILRDIDGNTFTASPLSADSAGNVYYNVVRVAGGDAGTSSRRTFTTRGW